MIQAKKVAGAPPAGGQVEAPPSPGGIGMWTVSGFAASMCLVGAFFLTLSPILKSMASELAALPHTLGYPGAGYSLGLGVTALVCSSLQDTLPRRWLMIIGMTLHVAGALPVSLANGWPTVVAGYTACGIGVGVFQPAVYGHVVATAPAESRARLVGRVNMGWAGSTLLGVPFAAWISEHWGWRSVGPLAIAGWALVAILIIDTLARRRSRAQAPSPGQAPDAHWSMEILRELHHSRVPWLFLITVLVFIGFYGVYSFLGVALIERAQLEEGGVGFYVLWYGLGFLLGSVMAKNIDRIGDRNALVLAALGLAAVLLSLPFTLTASAVLVCLMVLWGLFQVTAFTAITSIAGTMCPPHRGRSLSLKSSSVMLGAAVGTFAMGFVNARFGYGAVTVICGLATVSAAVLARMKLTNGGTPSGRALSGGRPGVRLRGDSAE